MDEQMGGDDSPHIRVRLLMSLHGTYRVFGFWAPAAVGVLAGLAHLAFVRTGECQGIEPADYEVEYGIPPDAFVLAITNSDHSLTSGVPIAVDVTLTYFGDTNIVVETRWESLIPILVRDDGKVIRSEQRKVRWEIFEGRRVRIPDVLTRGGPKVRVAKGQQVYARRKYLSEWYGKEPLQSGTYRFLLLRMTGVDGFQVSNMIEINVLAK